MTNDLKMLSAMTALNNMMKKGHFDICCLKNVAELLGVQLERESHQILQPLHCINFSDMPKELRDQIPVLIQQALSSDPNFVFKDNMFRSPTVEYTLTLEDHTPSPAKSRGFLYHFRTN